MKEEQEQEVFIQTNAVNEEEEEEMFGSMCITDIKAAKGRPSRCYKLTFVILLHIVSYTCSTSTSSIINCQSIP